MSLGLILMYLLMTLCEKAGIEYRIDSEDDGEEDESEESADSGMKFSVDEDGDSEGGKKFAQTWPADVHLVGKDILRFHAVIWPAMLMAAGIEIPKKVFAHGWLLVGGEKMSKSKLTGIAPSDITDHFGVDAFRYYFLRAIPFGSDGSFSWEDMSARYTSELANDFGNLASRLAAMIEKYCEGKVPAVAAGAGSLFDFRSDDD